MVKVMFMVYRKAGVTHEQCVAAWTLPAKIDETLRPLVISVEGGEVSGR